MENRSRAGRVRLACLARSADARPAECAARPAECAGPPAGCAARPAGCPGGLRGARPGLLPAGAVDGDVVGAVVEREADALQVRHGLAGLAPDEDQPMFI